MKELAIIIIIILTSSAGCTQTSRKPIPVRTHNVAIQLYTDDIALQNLGSLSRKDKGLIVEANTSRHTVNKATPLKAIQNEWLQLPGVFLVQANDRRYWNREAMDMTATQNELLQLKGWVDYGD